MPSDYSTCLFHRGRCVYLIAESSVTGIALVCTYVQVDQVAYLFPWLQCASVCLSSLTRVSSRGWCGTAVQLEKELASARASANPGDLKGKEAELQRAKEEARRLGEERAKAQKVTHTFLLISCLWCCAWLCTMCWLTCGQCCVCLRLTVALHSTQSFYQEIGVSCIVFTH